MQLTSTTSCILTKEGGTALLLEASEPWRENLLQPVAQGAGAESTQADLVSWLKFKAILESNINL